MSYEATIAGYKLAIAEKKKSELYLVISHCSGFFLRIVRYKLATVGNKVQFWGGKHVLRIENLYLNSDFITCNCVSKSCNSEKKNRLFLRFFLIFFRIMSLYHATEFISHILRKKFESPDANSQLQEK